MELYKGRPDTNEGRLEREIRVYDFLDDHGIEYWRTDHAPADTMEVCSEIDAVLGATICKNLFLCNRQKTQFYLLMMPGDKPFKTKEITSQIGSARLSFASPEDVQLLVDEDVMKGEYLGCHPCVNTSSMKVRTEDIFGKFLEAVHHDMIKVTLTGE